MSPGHVVLKGGRVTRARPRARGGRNATGQATGLWRIFYKYGSRLGTSPEFSGGGINNYYVVYAETRSFLLGRGGRGPSALTGAIEKGTGTGMARSAGAGRRNPNMSGPSRTELRGADTGRTTRPTAIRDRLRPGLGIGTGPSAAGAGSDATEGPRAAAGAWRARWGRGWGWRAWAVNRDRRHGVDVRYTHKTIDAQAIYPTYSVNITHHVRCSTFNASFTTCRSLRPFPESHMQ